VIRDDVCERIHHRGLVVHEEGVGNPGDAEQGDRRDEAGPHERLTDDVGRRHPVPQQVTVCHFPPGTSKWNKIEHRLFSHISMNWRGRPLVSHQVILELIAATQTRSGLRVQAELDQRSYPLGIRVADRELAAVPLQRQDWHGEWNYTWRTAEAHRA
jgi:hypothetical protein